MKTLPRILFAILISAVAPACSNSDDDVMAVTPTGESKTYDLSSVAEPGISGTATFIENDDNSVTIDLALMGTPQNGSHPAHIHLNTAAEGGDIALTLGTVVGSTGKSTITVSTLDNGSPISYDALLDFDGYINVHLSASELGTLVAQGDIGENELTGERKIYNLNESAVAGISGTATFEERKNGEALATLQLDNTPDGGTHPAHIHSNTAIEGGDIIFSFNPVDGTSGMSKTNVETLDDETPFGYDDVMEVNGYINVHLSSDDLGTIVAQGDIGQNELTGQSVTYNLQVKDVPGISGTATFEERNNGEALATIQLENTPPGGMHPAHIHENTAAVGGDIIFTFNPINGDNGLSKTNVAALDDETSFGYGNVLDVDGYINVHLSAAALEIIVAQGNIGTNAP